MYGGMNMRSDTCCCHMSPQMPEVSAQSCPRGAGGGAKQLVPPHALALYQQQITMAHELSQEAPPTGKPSQQQLLIQQAPRDRPQARSPAPMTPDKDGMALALSTHKSEGKLVPCMTMTSASTKRCSQSK